MPTLNFFLMVVILISGLSQAFAEPWESHQEDILEIERGIFKYQQELDVLVEKKKNTRDRARIEQTLQRIVEIHAELISLRKSMDNMRDHLSLEHPDKVRILDNYDSRMYALKKQNSKHQRSPLSRQLDDLMLKVQLKFASFIRTDEQKEEMVAVESILQKKRKKKKEREADVYLRKRSKIKLVK